MINYVHGTRHVGLQVYAKVIRHKIISSNIQEMNDNSDVKSLCGKLTTSGKRIDDKKKYQMILSHLGD